MLVVVHVGEETVAQVVLPGISRVHVGQCGRLVCVILVDSLFPVVVFVGEFIAEFTAHIEPVLSADVKKRVRNLRRVIEPVFRVGVE